MAKKVQNEFEKRVQAFIIDKRLLGRHAPVVVALSGGADSVALLASLVELGYDCRAAHCNFHLRGEESMRDMRSVQSLCRQLDVDLYVRDFSVPEYMSRTGTSVEMACRELRYSWFGELLDRDGAQAVAVGHHREDRTETFMLNLLRGTGIAGLTSMEPRSGATVRPLLGETRASIEKYLEERGLAYVTDSSNVSGAHRRNRLRNRILPLMEELFPGAGDSILRTVANLERQRSIFEDAVTALGRKYSVRDGIDLSMLVQEERSPEAVLFELVRPHGFNFSQAVDMISHYADSGQHFVSADRQVVAEINRSVLSFSEASAMHLVHEVVGVNPLRDIVSPVRIEVSQYPVELFRPEGRGAMTAYFDIEWCIGPHQWCMRHYRRGDRMVPFGMKTSKLVSDIFAGAKYSALDKRRVWVMTCDDEIVWIPGLRNSAVASVGPETRRYVRMVYLPSAK